MLDRVKYFMLGLLFLIVAGVIAYDRWNSTAEETADLDPADSSEASVNASVGPDFVPILDPSGPVVLETKEGQDDDAQRLRARKPQPLLKPSPREKPARRDVRPKPPVVADKKPGATTRVHVVRSGDSLERIALRYYRTRKGIAWIVDANGLKDKNRIYANQRLIIPAVKTGSNKAPRKARRTKKIPKRYTVRPGDGDLYAICRRFYGSKGEGARIARIMELNSLWSARVEPGTVLTLPEK